MCYYFLIIYIFLVPCLKVKPLFQPLFLWIFMFLIKIDEHKKKKKHLAICSTFVLFFSWHRKHYKKNNTINNRKNINKSKQNWISSSPWKKNGETTEDISTCVSFSLIPLEGATDQYCSRTLVPTNWSINNQPLVNKPWNKSK